MDASRTLVVTSEDTEVIATAGRVVRTLLDMVMAIEWAGMTNLVLAGRFARDHQLISFLRKTYPTLPVVIKTPQFPGSSQSCAVAGA
jgi:hypothetical protein